ncbi:MAG: flavodoxin family protein [Methanocorpusculum sp.]|nr:flavodoxin family protein [Methanocorpusculum sp.]
MSLSILAITTSPRRHGNSETALDTFLAELPPSVTREKVVLNDLKVAPCKGCGFCEKTGMCVQKDDFLPLAEKIQACSVLVFASPVYSLSVCAQAKAMIDRCQMFWAQKYVLHTFVKPAGKFGVFIATAGQSRENIFEHTVPVARFLFNVAGIGDKRTLMLLLSGLDARNDFKESADAIERTKHTAAQLVSMLEQNV